jgi:phage tail-like protein
MLNTKDIKTTYPLPVYNYKVEIDSETMGFSEVSGLNIEVDTITYKHGLSCKEGVLYLPGMEKPVNITMKRGVVTGKSQLYKWISSIKLNKVSRKDISIHLCDETGIPVVTWKVQNAFPIKLEAPTFDAKSNDVAIESLSLMANKIFIEY